MLKAAAVVVLATVLLLAGVTSAPAIAIFSNAAGDGFGTWSCVSGCLSVFNITAPPIQPGGPWQNPTGTTQPSAKWISNDAASGTVGPANGTTVVFRYTFLAPSVAAVNLNVWADDTSGVSLDGAFHSLTAPAAGPFVPTCAQAPIGCQPGKEGVFNFGVGAGLHTLDFDFSQLGGSGTEFGLLAAGQLTPSAVPEPATMLLLGSALTAAGVFSSRRFRKSDALKATLP